MVRGTAVGDEGEVAHGVVLVALHLQERVGLRAHPIAHVIGKTRYIVASIGEAREVAVRIVAKARLLPEGVSAARDAAEKIVRARGRIIR